MHIKNVKRNISKGLQNYLLIYIHIFVVRILLEM